jgi:hypothetical protein
VERVVRYLLSAWVPILGGTIAAVLPFYRRENMVEIKFDKPPVHYSRSGVVSVKAEDILRSRVGREEINQAAEAAIALGLRRAEQPRSEGRP